MSEYGEAAWHTQEQCQGRRRTGPKLRWRARRCSAQLTWRQLYRCLFFCFLCCLLLVGVSLLLLVKLLPVAESAVILRQTLNLFLCGFQPARMTMYVLRHVWKLFASWRRHLGSRLSRGLGHRRSNRSSRCTCTWVSGKAIITHYLLLLLLLVFIVSGCCGNCVCPWQLIRAALLGLNMS